MRYKHDIGFDMIFTMQLIFKIIIGQYPVRNSSLPPIPEGVILKRFFKQLQSTHHR